MDLGKKLRETLAKLTNKPYVDEEAVKALIKDLQRVLIASDVNVKLVLEFSKHVEQRALGSERVPSLSMREHVLKVVYDELVGIMGKSYQPRLDKHRILVLGLYGSGKTTTCSKLAYFYKSKGLSVGLVGADTDRPAAQDQLEQLAAKIKVPFYTTRGEKNPSKIVETALKHAKEEVMIIDSAGRSALDEELAQELKGIVDVLKPEETYLVVSGDIGQIAGKQAQEFDKITKISGVIITKMDGSGKGGGALSAVAYTDAKTSFIGLGEKVEDLEVYDAPRFVGRLLGVPDFQGLIEKVNAIAKEHDMSKLQSEEFTIETFYEQLKAAKKMGPLGGVMSMMGMSDLPKEVTNQGEEKLKKFESMINSMTLKERKDATLLKKSGSRIARIAKGSGCTEQDVREFLNQFEKMEKMLGAFKHNRGFRKQMERMMKGGGKMGDIGKLMGGKM